VKIVKHIISDIKAFSERNRVYY